MPIWNVIYHKINLKQITVFNIFSHGGFRTDIQKAAKNCKSKEEFADKIRDSLIYYFRSKCEWEITISPWVGGSKTKNFKLDVFGQIMCNWEVFWIMSGK